MKKLNLLIIITLFVLSVSVTASATQRTDVTMEGIHTNNNSIVTNKNGYTITINKSIEKVESNRYIDVKLTLKSSTKSSVPKTSDSNNMTAIILLLIISGGSIALFRKKWRKTFISLALVITFLPAMIPVDAEPAGPVYITAEHFSDETLRCFTFDKMISISNGNSDKIADNTGKVTGIRWSLNHSDSEQSVVYRLLLNESIPDNLIDEEISVSRANLDFTDPNGKTANINYPNVSVKINGITASAPPSVQPVLAYTVSYDANGGTGSYGDANITSGDSYTIKKASDIGISRPGHVFLSWNTQANELGTKYDPLDITVLTGDITLYAQWGIVIPPEN